MLSLLYIPITLIFLANSAHSTPSPQCVKSPYSTRMADSVISHGEAIAPLTHEPKLQFTSAWAFFRLLCSGYSSIMGVLRMRAQGVIGGGICKRVRRAWFRGWGIRIRIWSCRWIGFRLDGGWRMSMLWLIVIISFDSLLMKCNIQGHPSHAPTVPRYPTPEPIGRILVLQISKLELSWRDILSCPFPDILYPTLGHCQRVSRDRRHNPPTWSSLDPLSARYYRPPGAWLRCIKESVMGWSGDWCESVCLE